jgi:hypothetical protein
MAAVTVAMAAADPTALLVPADIPGAVVVEEDIRAADTGKPARFGKTV